MGYLWLFGGVFASWVIGAILLRAMVVSTVQPTGDDFLDYTLHALIVALVVTLIVFVIRGGA